MAIFFKTDDSWARVAADFLLNLIGYNLVRIPKLLAQRG